MEIACECSAGRLCCPEKDRREVLTQCNSHSRSVPFEGLPCSLSLGIGKHLQSHGNYPCASFASESSVASRERTAIKLGKGSSKTHFQEFAKLPAVRPCRPERLRNAVLSVWFLQPIKTHPMKIPFNNGAFLVHLEREVAKG